MVTKTRPQISMDETILDNPELEQLLEDRQKLKESVASYRKADKEAKDKIRSIDTPTPYRVGRFVISKRDISAKSVSFETQASFSFIIKIAGED